MSEELIAGGAVALLSAYVRTADDPAAQPARQRMGRIHTLIRDSVGSQGDYARAIVQDVEDNPTAEDAQAALATIVAQQAVNDAQFRQALEDVVQDAVADDAVMQVAEHAVVGFGRDVVKKLGER
jgi:hypothetical protein